MILQSPPHIVWNQGYTTHEKSHGVLNYTMHIEMLMLEKWRRTKASIVTLITSTFPILETLNRFHFLVSHLCNQLFELLILSLHHFVLWFELVDNGSWSWVHVQCTQFCSKLYGVWLGVHVRNNFDTCWKKIGLCAQFFFIILGKPMINVIRWAYLVILLAPKIST